MAIQEIDFGETGWGEKAMANFHDLDDRTTALEDLADDYFVAVVDSTPLAAGVETTVSFSEIYAGPSFTVDGDTVVIGTAAKYDVFAQPQLYADTTSSFTYSVKDDGGGVYAQSDVPSAAYYNVPTWAPGSVDIAVDTVLMMTATAHDDDGDAEGGTLGMSGLFIIRRVG